MKTQRSRNSFDALKRYSGVYQQMGRMFTDADWNELTDEAKHRLADVLTDVIGSGTPRGRGVMDIVENADGTKSYNLKWGYAYVDGIVAQLRPDPGATLTDPTGEVFEYDHQMDFPQAPALPADNYTLYLDVWERTVLSLEDEDLRDPGLHGADTCTRTQTMAQVKWCPTTVFPEDGTKNPPIGTAELTMTLRQGSTEIDPCDPCADEISLQDKVGNYLFRVEIHHVEYDGSGQPERMILKWSSENGAEQFAIGSEPPGFASDNWVYEFYSGAAEQFVTEKHLGRHLAPGFTPAAGELSEGYPDTVPTGYSLVRRWDGYCELLKSGTDWTLVQGADRGDALSDTLGADAHGYVDEGPTVTINLDAITLEITLADHQALAGDYWAKEVRQAINVAGDTLLSQEKPAGILHHYMILGSMVAGEFVVYDGDQCKRFEFPPLTDLWAKDVCFNNDACDMPEVNTVQAALDRLCQENDLRWHNKHLHGWGIVCGLIAQCGPDTLPPTDTEGDAKRRQVTITPGYALTCNGEDIVLDLERVIDLIDRIETLEAQGRQVLKDGDGTVCLRLDIGMDGKPEISVEAYDSDKHDSSLLDGTLLMDFFEHCIKDLITSITSQFQFLNSGELDVVEGGPTGLVSIRRQKFTSFLNLIVQISNSDNGSYVFLSHKEHLILRDIYLQLRTLLQSSTFCGMFQADDFPSYPFEKTGMTTYFGKNSHTRVKLHPSGKFLYTYGGTDNTINRYDVDAQKLVDVIEMPSAEGAEVSAITFSSNGQRLFAAGSVRGIDTVFGIADVDAKHTWEQMTILCDIELLDMQVAVDDPGLIYAVGRGQGLFFLRPDLFLDENKPRPIPTYAFNAVGHMAIDEKGAVAFCTSQSDTGADPDRYDQIAICQLTLDADSGDNLPPGQTLSLAGDNGNVRSGDDGLALRPTGEERESESGRLFVVVDGEGNESKQLLTYSLGASATPKLTATLDIEGTPVALAFHHANDHLLLAMEDGYRLQMVAPDGVATKFFRVPVQIQPTDVIVDSKKGQVYALNYISNTVSVIPADELEVTSEFLDQLTKYRTDILLAFYNLLSNLLQYLKDCFCNHLLVKCPTCNDADVIYLGLVEIRDNQVYKICNFDKRKYVKSFPTMEYWFSLIPVWPLLKSAVSQLCCLVFPDIFSKQKDTVIVERQAGSGLQTSASNRIKATTARQGIQTYARTDIGAIWGNQIKSLGLLGQFAVDDLSANAEIGRGTNVGVRKQALIQSSVNNAVKELGRNQVQVSAIKTYDEKTARSYAADYIGTPQRLDPGSKVTLYQKEGKVVFYSVEKASAPAVIEVPENVKIEVGKLEEQLGVLRTQVNSVKAERTAEEQKLAELETRRNDVTASLQVLDDNLKEISTSHQGLLLEITRDRPVSNVDAVTSSTDEHLKQLNIRTIGELANANSRTLSKADSPITSEDAKLIISNAKARLKK